MTNSPFKSYGGVIYKASNGFMPRTLSYSGLLTYLKCPRDYYYKYVLGIWNDEWQPSFAFGHVVHKMLETHINTGGNEDAVYNAMMAQAIEEAVDDHLLDDKKRVDFYKMAWGMYKDDVKLIGGFETVATEQAFEVPIRDPERPESTLPVRLKGIIDWIVKPYDVIDHKTAASFKDDKQYEIDHQPYVYAMAIKELYGVYPERVMFNSLLKRKRDYNSKITEIDFDRNRLTYVYRDIVMALQGMLLGEWQPGKGKDHKRMCDTCRKYKG